MNKKRMFYAAVTLYVLNFIGAQLEENKRLRMENEILKAKLTHDWDKVELN